MNGQEGLLLKQHKGKSARKNLVFTSAGDRSNLALWCKSRRNFDLWICYYGDRLGALIDLADYYVIRKGGKFPNLRYCVERWRDIFEQYDAIMVADDDLIMKTNDFSALFDIREKYGISVLQPAFDLRGKISHRITREQSFSFLRYTNFVEVTCPLFCKDDLLDFMSVYDPELVCWGVDWWFVEHIGNPDQRRFAVVDYVTCINPHDHQKGGGREIDRIQSDQKRIENWHRYKKRYGLKAEDDGYKIYKAIPAPLNMRTLYRALRRAFVKRLWFAVQ